mmetsp:Transcript_23832/g.66247  ORF Transcript_23832/g.66247 Transcript_23832/m.66247 type:complete len:228 (-) Transcript_23832:464-1147(-)
MPSLSSSSAAWACGTSVPRARRRGDAKRLAAPRLWSGGTPSPRMPWWTHRQTAPAPRGWCCIGPAFASPCPDARSTLTSHRSFSACRPPRRGGRWRSGRPHPLLPGTPPSGALPTRISGVLLGPSRLAAAVCLFARCVRKWRTITGEAFLRRTYRLAGAPACSAARGLRCRPCCPSCGLGRPSLLLPSPCACGRSTTTAASRRLSGAFRTCGRPRLAAIRCSAWPSL